MVMPTAARSGSVAFSFRPALTRRTVGRRAASRSLPARTKSRSMSRAMTSFAGLSVFRQTEFGPAEHTNDNSTVASSETKSQIKGQVIYRPSKAKASPGTAPRFADPAPSVLSVSSVVHPPECAFNRNFSPTCPSRSSPHDHPTISLIKTSNPIRASSGANSSAEPPTGNDSKNHLAATSGTSIDSAPALRQNFRNRSKCTFYQYSVFSGTPIPRPSTIRTTHILRMLRIHSLFPLTHASNSASLARNVPFFIALMVKLEFCVTKQRWQAKLPLAIPKHFQ